MTTILKTRLASLERAAGTESDVVTVTVCHIIDANRIHLYSIAKLADGTRKEFDGPGRMCERLRAAGFKVPDPLPDETMDSYCERHDKHRAALVAEYNAARAARGS